MMAVSSENQGQKVKAPVVIARCVACKATREIRPGEVPADDLPMCHECSMPMFAERAK